jgi:hypothetical protein
VPTREFLFFHPSHLMTSRKRPLADDDANTEVTRAEEKTTDAMIQRLRHLVQVCGVDQAYTAPVSTAVRNAASLLTCDEFREVWTEFKRTNTTSTPDQMEATLQSGIYCFRHETDPHLCTAVYDMCVVYSADRSCNLLRQAAQRCIEMRVSQLPPSAAPTATPPQVAHIEQENADCVQDIERAYEQKRKAQQDRERCEAYVKVQKERVAQLMPQLKATSESAADLLQHEIEQLRAQAAETEKKYEASVLVARDLGTKNEQLRQDNESYSATKVQAQADVNVLLKQLDEKSALVDKMIRDAVAQADAHVASDRQLRERYEKDSAAWDEETKKLRAQLADAEANAKLAQKFNKTASCPCCTDLCSSWAESDAIISEKTIAGLRNEVEQASAQLYEQRKALSSANEECERLRVCLTAVNATSVKLHEELREMEKQCELGKKSVRGLVEENRQLREKVNVTQETVKKAVIAEWNSVAATRACDIAVAEDTIAGLRSEMSQLRRANVDHVESVKQARAAADLLQHEIEQLRAHAEETEKKHEKAVRDLAEENRLQRDSATTAAEAAKTAVMADWSAHAATLSNKIATDAAISEKTIAGLRSEVCSANNYVQLETERLRIRVSELEAAARGSEIVLQKAIADSREQHEKLKRQHEIDVYMSDHLHCTLEYQQERTETAEAVGQALVAKLREQGIQNEALRKQCEKWEAETATLRASLAAADALMHERIDDVNADWQRVLEHQSESNCLTLNDLLRENARVRTEAEDNDTRWRTKHQNTRIKCADALIKERARALELEAAAKQNSDALEKANAAWQRTVEGMCAQLSKAEANCMLDVATAIRKEMDTTVTKLHALLGQLSKADSGKAILVTVIEQLCEWRAKLQTAPPPLASKLDTDDGTPPLE